MMDMRAILLGLALVAPATAQPVLPDDSPPGAEALPDPVIPAPAPAQPEQGAAPAEAMHLDGLFAALAVADPGTAKPLEQKIMAEWARNPSDAMTLLLARATRAMKAAPRTGAS